MPVHFPVLSKKKCTRWRRIRFLHLKEVQGSPHEYLYKIALFTGLREGEILGLGWEHIDLENGILTVKRQLRKEQKKGGQYYFSPPKNNRTRCLSLASSVVFLFRLQKLKQNGMRLEAGDAWQENGLVFSNQTGGYLSYRTVYDCFKRIVKKTGSQTTRFHDLRHPYVKHTTKKYNSEKQKTQATKIVDLIAWGFCFCFVCYSKRSWTL